MSSNSFHWKDDEIDSESRRKMTDKKKRKS